MASLKYSWRGKNSISTRSYPTRKYIDRHIERGRGISNNKKLALVCELLEIFIFSRVFGSHVVGEHTLKGRGVLLEDAAGLDVEEICITAGKHTCGKICETKQIC